MCYKCDQLREGMSKYDILANEDISMIVILDPEISNLAVEMNTENMSLLVRIQVSKNKEYSAIFKEDNSIKEQMDLVTNIFDSEIDPIEAIKMLAFCKIFSEKIDIEKSMGIILGESELSDGDNRIHNQPMQSITIH